MSVPIYLPLLRDSHKISINLEADDSAVVTPSDYHIDATTIGMGIYYYYRLPHQMTTLILLLLVWIDTTTIGYPIRLPIVPIAA